jgi:PIN domain nuclease of toxin-antitoxin system
MKHNQQLEQMWLLLIGSYVPDGTVRGAVEVKNYDAKRKKNSYISGINFWEIALKYSLGMLEFNGLNPEQISEVSMEAGYHVAELDYKVFASYYKLPKKENHKDPFDRMLIWQAIQNDYTLITKDEKIEQYVPDGLKVIVGT